MRFLFARLTDLLAEPWIEEPAPEDHPYLSPEPGSSAPIRFLQAAIVSAVAHAALLAVLAQFVIEQVQYIPEHLEVTVNEEVEPPELPDLDYQMAEARDEPSQTALSVLAMSMAPNFNREAQLKGLSTVTDLPAEVAVPVPLLKIEGMQLDERIMHAGSLGEEVMEVDGAVDRITEEIMTNLEASKVLVVWIMDASISLKADRQAAADRLERIYRELDELGASAQDALKSTRSTAS